MDGLECASGLRDVLNTPKVFALILIKPGTFQEQILPGFATSGGTALTLVLPFTLPRQDWGKMLPFGWFRPRYSNVMPDENEANRCDVEKENIDGHNRSGTQRYCLGFKTVFVSSYFILLVLNVWLLCRQSGPLATTIRQSEPRHNYELHKERWRLVLGETSPYTAPPSPEVDAAWEDISADGPSTYLKSNTRRCL